MDGGTTYDVRVYRTEVYKGATVTTYRVRWKVGDQVRRKSFRSAAQADSFRSSLLAAARNGEAFSLSAGRPVAWQRRESSMSWYDLTLAYTAAKWNYVSPNHRRGIAEALTDATEAMLAVDASPHARDEIRRALRSWAFSARLQGESEPPADLADVVRWLEGATIPLEELVRPGSGTLRTRALLDRISRKKDGTLAAANTANRKRMVLGSVLDHACETGVLAINPVKRVKWARPRALKTVDPRIVINIHQARRLLAEIRSQGRRGERLVAFFACMYYAALRPEEVIGLRRSHLVSLPAHGWGEMRLTHSEPRSGSHWTDNGRSRERRELKHRAAGDTRSVPIHPDLAQLLRAHLDAFGTGRDGRVFAGPRGGIVAEWAYLDVYHRARRAAFTDAEGQSQLAETPYTLRHAAVSTWLNAGVAAPQVAEWAGHSVKVLLRVYAKCIAGQQDEAKRRILQATRLDEPGANQ